MTPEIDPFDSPEYAAFVESMVPLCHCARNRPCDGVLAGGICDDIQDDGREEMWEYEWENEP